MEFTFSFLNVFWLGIYYTGPILLMLGLVIVTLGLIAGHLESWSKFESLYWAFITALTVGYGDFRPLHKPSRVMAGLIAILGIMFAGIIVAITVEATGVAFEAQVRPELNQARNPN